jgi:hypothetical protein
MSKNGTEERSPKAEHRLKIRFAGPVFQLVDLRMPVAPGAHYLFHVSNSHVKVDPKFVADNMEWVLAARFVTDVEDGQESIVAREAIIDLGGGDLANFHPNGLRIFSSSLDKASIRLTQTLVVYRIPEVAEKACFEIIKPEIGSTYSSRTTYLHERRARTEEELRLHYGSDFLPWKESILSTLAKKFAGIHLLRGDPGTGKTSFIRYLVEVLRTTHRFFFLPSYEYARVGNGALIEFLHAEQDEHRNLQFVVVMEDAEAVLMPRKVLGMHLTPPWRWV